MPARFCEDPLCFRQCRCSRWPDLLDRFGEYISPIEEDEGISPDNVLGTYYPEDYGAVGDGVTIDTAAIQAAIDAAGAAGGGTVALNRTYAIGNGGMTTVAMYGPIRYALHVNYDNVHIVGPGTFKLNAMPYRDTGDEWITLLFTRTGPGFPPGEGGVWCDNVGIRGVRFDNSALSHAERATLMHALESNISFPHCRNFHCLDNTFYAGFGEGTIHSILGSQYGRIEGNTVIGTPGNGVCFDGLRGSSVINNRIVGEYWGYTEQVNGVGIVTHANSDNGTNSEFNTIRGNVLINCRTAALSCVGLHQIISDNICYFTAGGATAINIAFNDNPLGEFPSTGTMILNNLCVHEVTIPSGVGIKIQGKMASIYDGSPIAQGELVVAGNRIGAGWQAASVALGPYVTGSLVINNICGAAVTEDETCESNVLTPNY